MCVDFHGNRKRHLFYSWVILFFQASQPVPAVKRGALLGALSRAVPHLGEEGYKRERPSLAKQSHFLFCQSWKELTSPVLKLYIAFQSLRHGDSPPSLKPQQQNWGKGMWVWEHGHRREGSGCPSAGLLPALLLICSSNILKVKRW